MADTLKTLAIDFDGVIHRYSRGWSDGSIYDPPMAGAVEAIEELKSEYNLVIFTSRQNLAEVEEWLEKYFEGWKPEITNRKPMAHAYIDDRAIRFSTWPITLKAIRGD